MSELTREDIEQFAEASRAFMRAASMIEKMSPASSVDNSSGTQQRMSFNFSAGKVSTLLAAVTCLVVLAFFSGSVITAGFWLSREFSRIDSQFVKLNDDQQVQDAYINKLRSQQQEKK